MQTVPQRRHQALSEGRPLHQRATIEALGLKKMHKTVEMPDNGAVRGMIQNVRHLVKVEEI